MSQRFRQRAGKASLALAMIFAVAALFAGAAQAESAHPYLGSLKGGETPSGEFNTACGATVDQNDYLYIGDYGFSSIDIYNPAREYVTSIPDNTPCELAVDSEGNVYVWNIETSPPSVVLLSPSESPPTSSTTYQPEILVEEAPGKNIGGVSVNPLNDHVLVTRRNGVDEYASAAEGSGLLSTEKIGHFLIKNLEGLLLSAHVYGANGDIYLLESSGSGLTERLEFDVLDPTGTELIHATTGPLSASAISGYGTLTVDQSNGDALITQTHEQPFAEGSVYELEPDGTLVTQIGPKFGPGESLFFEDTYPTGITVDNSGGPNDGDVYITSNYTDSNIFTFGALPSVPSPLTVTTEGPGTGTVTSNPAGINCGSGGAECSAEFERVELAATPDPGSVFFEWSGACTGKEACKVRLTEAKSVTAVFHEGHSLSVSKAGSGSGTVTSSPAGINCGATCSFEFEAGEEVALAATAKAGSKFIGWSGACSGTGECEVTMSAAKAVTANFESKTPPPPPPAEEIKPAPKPQPTCATDASLCPPGAPAVGPSAKVSSGKAQVQISCTGPGACSGTLKLTAKITTGKGKSKKSKTQAIGTASYSVAAGASATVQVKLSGPADQALNGGKTLKATATGAGATTTVALKGSVAKKKHKKSGKGH